MITQWHRIDRAGGQRRNQRAGHALYIAPKTTLHAPERLAHAGALTTCRNRAWTTRYGRRKWAAAVLLLLAALTALGVLAVSARPAAGAVSMQTGHTMPCRKWKDGVYRRAVMRNINGTFVIDYVVCKPAGNTTKR